MHLTKSRVFLKPEYMWDVNLKLVELIDKYFTS